MADQQYIDCSNAEQSVEDLIRQVIRIDDNGNVFVNTNCTCGGGAGCDYCPPEPINDGEVMTVSGGAWISAPAATSTTAKGAILNPGAATTFDGDGNLTITHNLGTEDIIVSIRELDGTTQQVYPYKPVNVNSVLVYCGQVIQGRYIVIAAL